jgi:hypothetical protein
LSSIILWWIGSIFLIDQRRWTVDQEAHHVPFKRYRAALKSANIPQASPAGLVTGALFLNALLKMYKLTRASIVVFCNKGQGACLPCHRCYFLYQSDCCYSEAHLAHGLTSATNACRRRTSRRFTWVSAVRFVSWVENVCTISTQRTRLNRRRVVESLTVSVGPCGWTFLMLDMRQE